jgi:hypothetical protein
MAEMTFSPRATIYRGRGRPPAHVPPAILQAVWQTHQTGTECRINVTQDTAEDVAEFRRALRRAASQLGVKVHVQRSRDRSEIVFWGEPA